VGEHRLTRELRALLHRRRTAALGTVSAEGDPFVSMVPYAIDTEARELVLHVSGLAAHTGHMAAHPRVSLLVVHEEAAGEPVHALPRVTLLAEARACAPGSADARAARQAYLARFPEAGPMTQLGDFRFVRLRVLGARQVAGFGAARSLGADEVRQALGPGT
jgi:putative heme iron utilization protein